MRLAYALFILLLILMTPAQCQQTAEDWYNGGTALSIQGKYDDAIKAYDEAINLDPNLAAAWDDKGNALNSLGRYDEAFKACDEAIRLDPKDAMAWGNKGNALNGLGKYDEAFQGL